MSASGRRPAPGPPRPAARLLLLLEARLNLLRAMKRAAERYGDLAPLHWGAGHAFLLVHPESIRHVLEERAPDYPGSGGAPLMRALLGEGLAMIEGERWQRDRDLMLPAFHRGRLAALAGGMAAATRQMLDRWRERARRGEAVDLALEARRLTLDIALRSLFGPDLEDAETIGRSWYAVTDALRRKRAAALARRLVGKRDGEVARQALGTLDASVGRLVAERRRAGGDRGDLLSMLLLARGRDGQGLDDRAVRDEAMNILFGAYDTTTTSLVWTWVLLCRHPAAEERLRAELDAVLGGRPPELEDTLRMAYMRQLLQESLRLYPPAWIYGRTAAAADEIRGHAVPRGSAMLIFPYLTHRHSEFWERPETFDPDRFSPERSAGRPRFAYLPFGRGPRQCIGSNFAMLEGQVVLAMSAQAFRMRLLTSPPSPERAGGVRPEAGIMAGLRPATAGR
jgi:cytochrome P450